jgi:hypothetical protein
MRNVIGIEQTPHLHSYLGHPLPGERVATIKKAALSLWERGDPPWQVGEGIVLPQYVIIILKYQDLITT